MTLQTKKNSYKMSLLQRCSHFSVNLRESVSAVQKWANCESEDESCDLDMDDGFLFASESDSAAVSSRAESSMLGGLSRSKKDSQTSTDDKMAQLVSLQKSNGSFEICSDEWKNSIFEVYAGKFENVQSSCPTGVKNTEWFTALAVKILELKMAETRDLWELVAKKSKKYILTELKEDKEQCEELLSKAGEYINKL